MADDVTNPGGGEGDKTQPTPEEIKAARRAAIEKVGIEVVRGAAPAAAAPAVVESDDDDVFEIDLEGVSAEQAKAIRKALKEGRDAARGAQTIAGYAMEQARRVAALEIQAELGLDADEVKELERSLAAATRPDQLDLTRRELVIKLKSDGSFAKPVTKPAAKGGKEPKDERTFDSGRGSGGNQSAALQAKIDAIDLTKPGAMEELAKLQKEVDDAQARFNERVTRGR